LSGCPVVGLSGCRVEPHKKIQIDFFAPLRLYGEIFEDLKMGKAPHDIRTTVQSYLNGE
jgi:hypothetical protein